MPIGPERHSSPGEDDPRAVAARIERLLDELRSTADAPTLAMVETLVRLLMELYGGGLERIVQIVGTDDAAGRALVDRLAADDLVASLLVLHGLHPLTVEERVRQALDRVRPYLGADLGRVELVEVDADGVAHLRLAGSRAGGAASPTDIRRSIERAIEEQAPEVTGITLAGLPADGAATGFVPLASLRASVPAAPLASGEGS